MKVIHTADWHLGARLHDQERADEHRAFLAFLLGLIETERPDALLVSGDIFDMRQPGLSAQRQYYAFLADLAALPYRPMCVITAGNHDSAYFLASAKEVLRFLNVRVVAKAGEDVADEVVTLPRADGSPGLAIAAIPFLSEGELNNIARAAGVTEDVPGGPRRAEVGWRRHVRAVIAAARAAAPGVPVVALAQGTLTGATVSDDRSERGRRIGGVEALPADAFAGADYVALGHLHLPQAVGAAHNIRYAGAPLAMSFDEAARAKSVTVVEPGERAGDPIAVREVPTPCPVALRRFTGTAEDVRRDLAAFAATDAPAYVAARVTEGEGDLTALWPALQALFPPEKAARLLLMEDARAAVAPGTGLAAVAEGQPLDALEPLEVARLRLDELPNLSDEERAAYLDLVKEAMGDLA